MGSHGLFSSRTVRTSQTESTQLKLRVQTGHISSTFTEISGVTTVGQSLRISFKRLSALCHTGHLAKCLLVSQGLMILTSAKSLVKYRDLDASRVQTKTTTGVETRASVFTPASVAMVILNVLKMMMKITACAAKLTLKMDKLLPSLPFGVTQKSTQRLKPSQQDATMSTSATMIWMKWAAQKMLTQNLFSSRPSVCPSVFSWE